MADSPSNAQVQQQPLISGDHFVTATRDRKGHLPGAEALRAALAPIITTKSFWEITAKAFTDMKTMKRKNLTKFSTRLIPSRSCTAQRHEVFRSRLFKLQKMGKKNEGTKRKAGARQVELLCTSSTHPSRGQTSVQKKLCCRNAPRTCSGGDGKCATTAHGGEGKRKGGRNSYTRGGRNSYTHRELK